MLITFGRYKYFFFYNSVIDRLPSFNTYVFAGADELQNRRTMQVQVNLFAHVTKNDLQLVCKKAHGESMMSL